MWLRAARHRVFARGMGALLAAIVCASALDWGHRGGDDPDCSPAIVLHDHGAHRFTAAPAHAASPHDHCYICHALRLLHSAVGTRTIAREVDLRASRHSLDRFLAARLFVSDAAGSRAPPAVLL